MGRGVRKRVGGGGGGEQKGASVHDHVGDGTWTITLWKQAFEDISHRIFSVTR